MAPGHLFWEKDGGKAKNTKKGGVSRLKGRVEKGTGDNLKRVKELDSPKNQRKRIATCNARQRKKSDSYVKGLSYKGKKKEPEGSKENNGGGKRFETGTQKKRNEC